MSWCAPLIPQRLSRCASEFDASGGFDGVTASPVQVNVHTGIEHSFLRLKIADQVWLYDPVGVESFEPFLGLESEAPLHLQGYRLDTFMENDRLTKR